MAAIAGAQIKSAVNVKFASSFSGVRLTQNVASVSFAPLKMNRLSVSCNAETLDKVRGIIAKQLAKDIEVIKPDAPFSELGADSLDTVEIVMAFEEEFGVTIDDSLAEEIKTVGDAAKLIEKLQS